MPVTTGDYKQQIDASAKSDPDLAERCDRAIRRTASDAAAITRLKTLLHHERLDVQVSVPGSFGRIGAEIQLDEPRIVREHIERLIAQAEARQRAAEPIVRRIETAVEELEALFKS
jgi:hypothetical protein